MKIHWAMKSYARWMNCRNYQVKHGLISEDRKVPDPDELLLADKRDIVKTLSICFGGEGFKWQ